jgi:transmembrane sensor
VGTNVQAFDTGQRRRPVNRQAAAEAAVWLARLHGPSRSASMEREFQAWLSAADEHRHAFERCTEVWQEVPRLTLANAFGAGAQQSGLNWGWAAAVFAGVLVAGAWVWPTGDSYITDIGEYRQVALADGSRLSLNTATKLRVTLDQTRREVEIQSGEALFEVAKDPTRPFIVRAGGHQVRALGTMFVVRRLPSASDALAVTLFEGRVEVSPVQPSPASTAPVLLQPGQRLELTSAKATPHLEHPSIEHATAWTRQEVVMDDMSLPEAITEMNRYSRRPIVLEPDPRLALLRVSGVYRAGDSEGFAQAVAALHGLETKREGERLVIRKARASADRSSARALRARSGD